MKNILLFVLLLFSVDSSAQTDALKQAMAKRDYVQVVKMAEDCYKADTSNIECVRMLASASNKLGDQANAKKYYTIIAEKDSANVEAHAALASIYEQQQRYPRAIKYYTILNKLQPKNGLYFRKNAALYSQYNEKLEAFSLYAKANKLNPRDVLSLKGLAELALDNKQETMADSLIQTALSYDSTNVGMHYLLARSKYKQKQYDSVTFILQKVQRYSDLNSYHNKMLGFAYLQIDSLDLAVSKLQLALTEDEYSEKLHFYLATAFEKQGNIDGALMEYEKAVEFAKSPDLDLYHRHTARIANKEKDYKKALSHYKDAYKYGKDPLVLYYLATISDIYYKDKSIAIRYYKQYLKSSDQNKEYKRYAKDRSVYLKEINHLSKN